ncbi:hypothetical protein FGIG_09379 [Fasciola gigantica]|uniref:Uncharacterized protein n=1 Tax=Fasciola gigantica TaxID=46835 RepID=A0A504Z874_FASGI|nr:hypothetical protein FGIG_09379 [Fasciola gigantica]
MADSKQPDVSASSESLKKFLNTLPLDQRQPTAVILFNIRKNLHDVIPAQGPVHYYSKKYLELRSLFTRLPPAVRQNSKSILINALEQNIDSPFLLALCTTCLCLLDLVAIRNVDRIDLEAKDVQETVLQLNRIVIPKLTEKVFSLRTNMPRLEAWSLGMILFTYKACIECISSQLDLFDDTDEGKVLQLNYDRSVITHTCMPVVLSQFLQSQSKRRPYPTPPSPYKLFCFLFSCSVSTNYELMSRAQAASSFNPNISPLEMSEPPPPKRPRVTPSESEKQKTIFISDLSTEDLETILMTASTKHVLCILHQLVNSPPETGKTSPDSVPAWVGALKCTPHILVKFQHRLKQASRSGGELYEQVHSLLLQLWYRASEQRMLLSGLPQSYLWLTGLVHPNFQQMSETGFLRSVVWLSRFLTAYQSLFRSNVLASPHWYLQAITDVVVAVIDRLEKNNAADAKQSAQLENMMCACLVAIGRPYSTLGADESEVHAELSRVIKVPLETILARMASCRTGRTEVSGPTNVTSGSVTNEPLIRPILGPRVREILNNYLLLPMIKAMDPWALRQAMIGIRPVTASLLLKQLVSEVQMTNDRWDGALMISRLKEAKKPIAVGGLHVAEKLAVKRKRR